MRPLISLRAALEDENLLGAALAGPSWHSWRSLLLATMGEPLRPDELIAFQSLTHREKPPGKRIEELWVVAGRRGGKTQAMSTLACYIAGLCDHKDVLAPGERGVLLLVAPDMKQAKVALGYAIGLLQSTPALSELLLDHTADTLRLTTGIDLEVRSASFRRLRGMTSVAVLADEAAFWRSESSSNPDTEILSAALPSLSTTQGPLVVISSPYAKKGELFETYSRHYGEKGDPMILVAHGTSRDFNPSLPQSVIDRALERDVAAASAEYLAIFRTDVENFVTREAVMACVEPSVHERLPERVNRYVCFVDPSGGSSDSMTMAIAHRSVDTVVLDLIRERKPPFSPEQVAEEFSDLAKRYRVTKVYGDRYGGEWPREQFRKHRLNYEPAEKSKSELYVDMLPLINSGACDLLDNDRLIQQLCSLERRVSRGGRDVIDHPPAGRDDVCNAAAGAIVVAMKRGGASGSNERPTMIDRGRGIFDVRGKWGG